ncbi:hypothetical protein PT2222_260033 [Paraburkholderia tropica]
MKICVAGRRLRAAGRHAMTCDLLVVNALTRGFESREQRVDLRRIGIELLHGLHAFVGHFLLHVAVVELRDAALRVRERLEADLRDRIFRLGRLVVRRQLAPAAREIGVDLRRFHEGEQTARVGLVLRLRGHQQHVHGTVFGGWHVGVDDREAEEAHVLLHVGREAGREERAHQHHRGLAVHEHRRDRIDVVRQRVVHEVVVVDQRLPGGEDLLHARVGVGNLTGHQLLMERVAVDAQIQIVEPRGERPAVARGDGDRLHADGLELLAGVEEFVPRFRFFLDAGLLEQVLAIEETVRVIAERRGVLLALVRRRFLHRGVLLVPAVLRPVGREVFEQAALRVIRHALAVVPRHHIGRIGREPAAHLHLVGLFGHVRHLEVDVGIGLLELVESVLPGRALIAARRYVDGERGRVGAGARERGGHQRHGRRGARERAEAAEALCEHVLSPDVRCLLVLHAVTACVLTASLLVYLCAACLPVKLAPLSRRGKAEYARSRFYQISAAAAAESASACVRATASRLRARPAASNRWQASAGTRMRSRSPTPIGVSPGAFATSVPAA